MENEQKSEVIEEVVVEQQTPQQTEINDIVEDFLPPVEKATETTEVKTEEVKTDVKEGEEQQTKEAGEQVQATEPVKEGEAVVKTEEVQTTQATDTKVVELTNEQKLAKENEELRKMLNDMAGKVTTPIEAKPKTEEEQKVEREALAKQVLAFIPSDEVFDDVMRDPNKFNAVLTSVVNTAVERALRLTPQVATQDLEEHSKYVGYVSGELANQHPDWSLTQVLQEAEKEARAKLRLPKIITNNVVTQEQINSGTQNLRTVQNNPGFVPGSGGARKGSGSADGNLSVQEKQIVDLIS
jgi:hypothetical protein